MSASGSVGGGELSLSERTVSAWHGSAGPPSAPMSSSRGSPAEGNWRSPPSSPPHRPTTGCAGAAMLPGPPAAAPAPALTTTAPAAAGWGGLPGLKAPNASAASLEDDVEIARIARASAERNAARWQACAAAPRDTRPCGVGKAASAAPGTRLPATGPAAAASERASGPGLPCTTLPLTPGHSPR